MLNTKPWLFGVCSIEDLLSEMSEVGVARSKGLEFGISPDVRVAEDNDVACGSERISEEGDGLQDNLRVVGRGLIGA